MKVLIVPLLSLAAMLAPATAQQVTIIPPAKAAPTNLPPLTLATAIELAILGHSDIAIAQRELAALEADASQAALLPNPTVEFLQEGQDRENRSTTVQIAIPVELSGKRAARRDVAMIEVDVGRQVLSATRTKVRAEAVAVFYELYLAGERVRLARASAASAAGSSEAASRRVIAGKISPVEETRARVAEAAVQIELVQARRDWEEARLRMTAMWRDGGASFDTVAEPAEPLPALPSLPDLASRIDSSPALAKARLEVERRQAMARLEQARRVPDLSLLVGSKREGPDNRRQTILGLSLPLPLFDRNQGAVLASLRRSAKARDELAGAAVTLRTDMARAHARLAAALQEVAIIQSDILPGAQSAADAAAKGFDLGKFSFLEVLDAQRTLFYSKSQYVKAVAEAHRAAAEIAGAVDQEVRPARGPAPIQEKP